MGVSGWGGVWLMEVVGGGGTGGGGRSGGSFHVGVPAA